MPPNVRSPLERHPNRPPAAARLPDGDREDARARIPHAGDGRRTRALERRARTWRAGGGRASRGGSVSSSGWALFMIGGGVH